MSAFHWLGGFFLCSKLSPRARSELLFKDGITQPVAAISALVVIESEQARRASEGVCTLLKITQLGLLWGLKLLLSHTPLVPPVPGECVCGSWGETKISAAIIHGQDVKRVAVDSKGVGDWCGQERLASLIYAVKIISGDVVSCCVRQVFFSACLFLCSNRIVTAFTMIETLKNCVPAQLGHYHDFHMYLICTVTRAERV